MQEILFNKILSFLHGASIAFILLGTFATFTFFLSFGIPQALSFSFVFIFLSLLVILLIDSLSIKREMREEQKKQTEILQRIQTDLHDQKLLDN